MTNKTYTLYMGCIAKIYTIYRRKHLAKTGKIKCR
nr:MAG TPA: hypothetical protein [Caudoviricetes sp.]